MERSSGEDGRLLLAVDGGQTGIRVLLARADGSVLGRGNAGPVRHLFRSGGEETRSALHAAIRRAHSEAGLDPGKLAAAVCGMTSIAPDSPEAERVRSALDEIVTPERVAIVPDYVTNLAGASCGKPGVVVVAGGGSVAYGRADDGREAVSGGFGYLLGDEGGGYDIGRRATIAAIRAHDGRGRSTALEAIVKDYFAIVDLTELKRIVYASDFARERLAGLSPLTAGAAEDGDAVAVGIVVAAGEELARAALAVLRRLFPPGGDVSVFPTGGVFTAGAVIQRPFSDHLSAAWPGATVRAPALSPIFGALICARRLLDEPAGTEFLHRLEGASCTDGAAQ